MVDGLVSLRLKLAVNLLQLVIELSDFRIGGTELSAEISNLDSETGLLFAQLVQKRGSCAGSASCVIGNDRCRDRDRIIRLGLAIDRFLLHAVKFGRRHFFIKFIQLFGDDVLLIVDPENLVLLLVAYELLLRGFHFHLQVNELFGKPVGGLHGGFEFGLEVLLDISGREGIHSAGGELRIGAGVMNLDNPGVGNKSDVEVSPEASQQSRNTVRIGLQRIGDQVGLLLVGLTAELGTLIEIQLPDYLQRHQIALQDANLGVEIALVVVVDHRHGVLEGNEVRIGLIDDNLACRFVDGSLAQAGDGDGHEDADYNPDDHPLALDKNAQVFAHCGFLRRGHVIKRGGDRPQEFSRFARLQFAQSVVSSWIVTSWNQGPQ